MTDELEPTRDDDEWASFERRFRSAYNATPGAPPRITILPVSRRESPLRRYGWLAACVAAGAAFLVLVPWMTQRNVARQANAITSFAQFALTAPTANRVTVVGDFNQWDPHASPLARSADGRWRMRISMQPGRHEYAFVIDNRRWVTDPLAPQAPDIGFGQPNSVVLAAPVRQ
jgi:hypothetical protein